MYIHNTNRKILSIDSKAIENFYPRLIKRGSDTFLFFQGKEEKIEYNPVNNKIEIAFPENFTNIALAPRSSKTSEQIIFDNIKEFSNYLKKNEFTIQNICHTFYILYINNNNQLIYRRIF